MQPNYVTYILTMFLLASCSSSYRKHEYGLQNELSTYLPARIIVMPCQAMPEILLTNEDKKLNFGNLKNVEDIKTLCTKYDEFILKSFENQPFMRGFSPKATRRILAENKAEDLLRDPWSRVTENSNTPLCKSCTNSIEIYMNSILTNKAWLFWLAEISLNTRHSDAILFPLLTWGYTDNHRAQGIESSSRVGKIELILIDVNSGKVIWARERNSAVLNRRLVQAAWMPSSNETKTVEALAPPDLNTLSLRLFQDDLWRDFPGRLNYK